MLAAKNLPASEGNVGDPGSVSGSKRSTGGGHDYPFQHSGLENLTDSGVWRATVYRVVESDTTGALSVHAHDLVQFLHVNWLLLFPPHCFI